MTVSRKTKSGGQKLSRIAWRATPAAMAQKLSAGAWKRAPHLDLLSKWLAQAAFGERRRLVVSMPPRHGKSLLTSHWFPVWYLSLFPGPARHQRQLRG